MITSRSMRNEKSLHDRLCTYVDPRASPASRASAMKLADFNEVTDLIKRAKRYIDRHFGLTIGFLLPIFLPIYIGDSRNVVELNHQS